MAKGSQLRRVLSVPLLCDRHRYAGSSRASGEAPFDQRWLDGQRRLGLSRVLSDSGYIGRGDVRALTSILDQTVAAGADVTAVLPMHVDWLGAALPRLLAEISAHAVPVALVLEHRNDPLSTLGTVRGLVSLLRQVPSEIGLLRSDVSALGAIAFGASWAAVGVRTSLRHLYPVTNGFAQSSGMPSALVDPALALIRVDRIATAWAATSDDPAWICHCSICHERTLDRLVSATQDEANQHTFELLLDHRRDLTSLPPGPLRAQSWQAQCRSAAFQYEALDLAGVAWKVPPFLRHWQAV